jgi:protein-arginine kinase activator protein McsA
MKNSQYYECKNCHQKTAILKEIFITKTLKFRLKMSCAHCITTFEITINGKEWNNLLYPANKILSRVNSYLARLIEEQKQLEHYASF